MTPCSTIPPSPSIRSHAENPAEWRRKGTDPFEDVVGLYLNPSEAAVVYCADKKTPVQGLAVLQPAFPMTRGMPDKRTHDDIPHGTTSLFVAFNTADGTVISSIHPWHRSNSRSS